MRNKITNTNPNSVKALVAQIIDKLFEDFEHELINLSILIDMVVSTKNPLKTLSLLIGSTESNTPALENFGGILRNYYKDLSELLTSVIKYNILNDTYEIGRMRGTKESKTVYLMTSETAKHFTKPMTRSYLNWLLENTPGIIDITDVADNQDIRNARAEEFLGVTYDRATVYVVYGEFETTSSLEISAEEFDKIFEDFLQHMDDVMDNIAHNTEGPLDSYSFEQIQALIGGKDTKTGSEVELLREEMVRDGGIATTDITAVLMPEEATADEEELIEEQVVGVYDPTTDMENTETIPYSDEEE